MSNNPNSSNVLARLRDIPEAPVPAQKKEIVQVSAIIPDENIDGYWLGKFGVTSYGIYIANDTTESEWLDFRKSVDKLDSARDWGKADWCRYGMDELKKSSSEVAALIGKVSPKTVESYATAARAADNKFIRIKSPSLSHFRLVADRSPDQQEMWMQKASDGKWSVKRLRAELDSYDGVVRSSRITKASAKKITAAQKRDIRKIVEKATKLPSENRHEIADMLRLMANSLEIE